ncbi:MAG: UDP-N-acetylmuramate dehydrogenase [Saprospiraceae bacterium]|nr:UDP-N-acetylmuramate dehydrogenase [Saprospiraceae bacterium]
MHIQKDTSLKEYNTFGISAKAKAFFKLEKVEEYDPGFLQDYDDLFILGGGSNIVLPDNFEGLVLKVEILGKKVLSETEEDVLIEVGAGENWHQFVLWTLEQGYFGLENLSLIPGTLGAAPIQNIGAYGVELSECLESVKGIFLVDGTPFSISKEECQFGYRDSIFKNAWKGRMLISHVCLRLSKTFVPKTNYGAIKDVLQTKEIDDPSASDISKAVISIRQSKLPDPKELGNAGSFFKNPIIPEEVFKGLQEKYPEIPYYPDKKDHVKIPAGWLIERSGWKGKKTGQVGMHEKQALVLVNYGEATSKEIAALSEKVQQSVFDQFGITLVREVTIL